jgi:uncharacterized membrane protein YvbJ
MEEIKCINCGGQLDEKQTTCLYCGAKYKKQKTSAGTVLQTISEKINSAIPENLSETITEQVNGVQNAMKEFGSEVHKAMPAISKAFVAVGVALFILTIVLPFVLFVLFLPK